MRCCAVEDGIHTRTYSHEIAEYVVQCCCVYLSPVVVGGVLRFFVRSLMGW